MKFSVLIIIAFLLTITLTAEEIDIAILIEKIDKKWQALNDYTATLKIFTKKDEMEQTITIEQKFLKPKWIRMHVIEGYGNGSVAIFNPYTKKVKGYKTGILKIIVLTLKLSDKRVSSLRGHRIDQGACITLIERIHRYNTNNEFISITKTTFQEKPAYRFAAEIADTMQLWGAKSENLWFDAETLFPLRIEQYTANGMLVHYSEYSNVNINTGLTEEDFK